MVIKSAPSRVIEVRNEQVDVLTRLDPKTYDKLAKEPHLKAEVLPDRLYWFIAWNPKYEPFRSVDVRRALTHAVHKKALIDKLYGSHADPCDGPVHPMLWGYDPDVRKFAFDPVESERLLDAAGWKVGADGIREKDGKRLSFRLSANTGNAVKEQLVPLVCRMLRDIGVDAPYLL